MQTLIVAALRRLDHREFVPLDALARSVDASATALSAALQQMAASGVPLQYQPPRGYRLTEPLDWLDAARIQQAVAATGLKVRVVDACGSTNVEMMHEARRGAPSGQVLAAEAQWEGRGRLGRRWHSGPCSALTFSLLWRTDRPVAALGGLSLAAGVAIVRALRRHDVEAQLKWPNDILLQGRKLGGVLIEVHGAGAGPCAAVVGIGINVRLRPQERLRIGQPAADLSEGGGAARPRSEWFAAILVELAAVLDVFARAGFTPMQAEWGGYHAHAGRAVELALPRGERVRGVAGGVDECGRLLLATDAGVQAVMTGDVSLRAGA